MAKTLVKRGGSLVLSPGGQTLLATVGPPGCCCGGCTSYFRGVRCGVANECTAPPDVVYICSNYTCPNGGVSFPENPVVSVGGGVCYSFNTSNPVPLPPGATVIAGGPCMPDCTNCSLDTLYYGVRLCECSSSPTTTNIAVPCDCYWRAIREGVVCPVVRSANGACFEVVPRAYSGNPANAEILCPVADGCCTCCQSCGQHNVLVGKWNCPQGGIVGQLKACCCPERYLLNARVTVEDYLLDGFGILCLDSRRTYVWTHVGRCGFDPGTVRIIRERRVGGCSGTLVVDQDTTIPHCTNDCTPVINADPTGPGGELCYQTFVGGNCILLGCTVPSQTVETVGTLNCQRFKGSQRVTDNFNGQFRIVTWDVAMTAIESEPCRFGCGSTDPIVRFGDSGGSVAGGGCSGCGGGGTKGLTI